MASKVVLADTSILIEFFRKTDKEKSKLISLVRDGYIFKISAISQYEIYTGATLVQHGFWTAFLEKIEVLPFNGEAAEIAVNINNNLKKKRKQIELADLFMAATAIDNVIPLATLNIKHFERVDHLDLLAFK